MAIGLNNRLLWHLPEDLRRFKRLTTGHCVVMGKRTWESLPVRPLPGRRNIVLTDKPNECFECSETAYSVEGALNLCKASSDVFVIGGGSVYRQFMPFADRLYITMVDKDYEADTFFPRIDPGEWELIEEEGDFRDEKNDFVYRYLVYRRRRH